MLPHQFFTVLYAYAIKNITRNEKYYKERKILQGTKIIARQEKHYKDGKILHEMTDKCYSEGKMLQESKNITRRENVTMT
jgi:hypothetical protein